MKRQAILSALAISFPAIVFTYAFHRYRHYFFRAHCTHCRCLTEGQKSAGTYDKANGELKQIPSDFYNGINRELFYDAISGGTDLPDYEDFILFIRDLMEEYRHTMKKGNEALEIEPQDPYYGPDFNHSENYPFVNLDINMTDVVVPNLSNFKLNKVWIDYNTSETYVDMNFGEVEAQATSNIKATVFGIPWYHQTPCTLTITGVTVMSVTRWSVMSDGNLKIESIINTGFEQDVEIYMEKMIGNSMVNKVLDMKGIYQRYKPLLIQSITDSITKLFDQNYGRIKDRLNELKFTSS